MNKNNPYEKYDYENYQDVYCNQPVAIRHFFYDQIGTSPKDILTIGCGNGYVEHTLVKNGHRVVGFELSEKACELSRGHGIDCRKIDVLELDTDRFGMKFDWIVAIDVWEHIPDSELFLKQVGRLLKPDGKLFLKAPNFGHAKFRIRYLKNGSLNTPYQLSVGHYAHYTYEETLKIVEKSSVLTVKEKYCFSYHPKPIVFNYQSFLFPNLTSLSIILILGKIQSKEGK